MELKKRALRLAKWLFLADPLPRPGIVETPNELRATIPPRYYSPKTIGFSFAGVMLGQCIPWGKPLPSGSFWLVAFLISSAGGALMALLFAFYNTRMSDETVVLDERALSHQSGSEKKRVVKTYEIGRIRNLRMVRPYWQSVLRRLSGKRVDWAEVNKAGMRMRALCFDYDGVIVRVGEGLSEAGARDLLPLLLERLPANANTPPTSESPDAVSRQAFPA